MVPSGQADDMGEAMGISSLARSSRRAGPEELFSTLYLSVPRSLRPLVPFQIQSYYEVLGYSANFNVPSHFRQAPASNEGVTGFRVFLEFFLHFGMSAAIVSCPPL